jgi:hypothetical protein
MSKSDYVEFVNNGKVERYKRFPDGYESREQWENMLSVLEENFQRNMKSKQRGYL